MQRQGDADLDDFDDADEEDDDMGFDDDAY